MPDPIFTSYGYLKTFSEHKISENEAFRSVICVPVFLSWTYKPRPSAAVKLPATAGLLNSSYPNPLAATGIKDIFHGTAGVRNLGN